MLNNQEYSFCQRGVHALERIATSLEKIVAFVESASAGFDLTEKTENKKENEND